MLKLNLEDLIGVVWIEKVYDAMKHTQTFDGISRVVKGNIEGEFVGLVRPDNRFRKQKKCFDTAEWGVKCGKKPTPNIKENTHKTIPNNNAKARFV